MTTLMNGYRVVVPPGKVGDPWDYQDPGLHTPAPCRIIPVTAAVRDRDVLERRERDRRMQQRDWIPPQKVGL